MTKSFDSFALPVTQHMPWSVRNVLKENAYGDLVEISRTGYGTPDGECDTEVWDMTFVNRETQQVHFIHHTYTSDNLSECFALPKEAVITGWASWVDHGMKTVIKNHDDGMSSIEHDDICIDHDKIRRMIYKKMKLKTLEVA
jgi:hypothetical protein